MYEPYQMLKFVMMGHALGGELGGNGADVTKPAETGNRNVIQNRF